MAKSIPIPDGLWECVGTELISKGYVKDPKRLRSIKNPAIRWLLLTDEEWKFYNEILLCFDLNFKKSEDPADGFSRNLYVSETLKRKYILRNSPKTKRFIIERGFIFFDNVILMNERVTIEIFQESRDAAIKSFGTFFYSLDSIRLAILILEMIDIIRYKLGKFFIGNISDESQVQYQILEKFLDDYHLNPINFDLPINERNMGQQEFEDAFFKNLWKALNQKKPTILRDSSGREIARFNIGELIKETKGTFAVRFGSIGLTVNRKFIGLGHIQYSPQLLGARNTQEILNSWNYIIKRFKVNASDLQFALEASSIVRLLLTGVEIGQDVNILSVFVDLTKLESLGINIEPKIKEFGRAIKGHLRSFTLLEEENMLKALGVALELRSYLNNVSSESALARIANFNGFEVAFGINPDLKINKKGIEVKNANSPDFRTCLRKALGQPHDIIAIEVNSLEQLEIQDYQNTWSEETNIKTAISNAIESKDYDEVVLLFMPTVKSGIRAKVIYLNKNPA